MSLHDGVVCVSIVDEVRNWRQLVLERERLRKQIASCEARQQELRNSLVSQVRSPGLDGLPKSPGYSDQVARLVAKILDELEDLTRQILALLIELSAIERRLDAIEAAVSALPEDQAEVLRAIFRDGHSQRSAANVLYRSRTRVRQLLDAGLSTLSDAGCPKPAHFLPTDCPL